MRKLSAVQKQVIKFTIIGILAVMVDLMAYYMLLQALPGRIAIIIGMEAFAKGLSFICGMVVTYSLNKFWTWKRKDRSQKRVAKFALLYGASLLINVGVNSLLLYAMHSYQPLIDLPHKYIIAFIGATGVSACVNFIGQKFWVFRSLHPIPVKAHEP